MPEGGMVFPKFHIDEIKKQEQRDLTRFDLDFDLPDHFLPEFPPAIFLTTRPDLGDVSQGQARHDHELLRAVQRHSEPEAARRLAAAGHAVSAAAVQPDRRPPLAAAEPRRGLLRLPRERPYQRRDAPGRRHSAAGVPPPHRHAVAARREHSAAVRFAAGAEDGRRFHRVRAAGGVLRRRSGDRDEEGRQRSGTRQPGPLHGRVSGAARLPAGAEARRVRQARSGEGDASRNCAGRNCSSARPNARRAIRRRTTPTTRCTTCRPSGSSSRR